MCGGGPPPGTSCDSTALTTPPVSRPWMRMTIGMPRTLIFLPPPEGIWIGFIRLAVMFCRTAPAGKRVYNWPVFCYALRTRQNRLATKVPRCSSRFVQESAIRIALRALFDLTELSHGDPVVVAIH